MPGEQFLVHQAHGRGEESWKRISANIPWKALWKTPETKPSHSYLSIIIIHFSSNPITRSWTRSWRKKVQQYEWKSDMNLIVPAFCQGSHFDGVFRYGSMSPEYRSLRRCFQPQRLLLQGFAHLIIAFYQSFAALLCFLSIFIHSTSPPIPIPIPNQK
jgi:hypothetical protein